MRYNEIRVQNLSSSILVSMIMRAADEDAALITSLHSRNQEMLQDLGAALSKKFGTVVVASWSRETNIPRWHPELVGLGSGITANVIFHGVTEPVVEVMACLGETCKPYVQEGRVVVVEAR